MLRAISTICAALALAGGCAGPVVEELPPGTPLHDAIVQGNVSEVERLLESGADPNEWAQGRTALHAAVWADNTDILVLLLTHGADPGSVDSQGETPYEKAEVWERENALEVFNTLARGQ